MNTSSELKDDSKIWRYMNFTKFISMLSNKALHFSRADIFVDKWEGAVTNQNLKELEDNLPEKDIESTKKFIPCLKKLTFINCWHISEYESAAMWDLYGSIDGTIAIESNIGTLNRIFSDINKSNKKSLEFEITFVEYIDYTSDYKNITNSNQIFSYKRKSFEHEKELRIIFQNKRLIETVKNFNIFEEIFKEKVFEQSINIEELIKIIHVSPTAPVWFFELVEKVVKDYKLNIEVKQSDLYKDPIY